MLAPVPIRCLLHLLPAQTRNPANKKTENPQNTPKSTNQRSPRSRGEPSPLDVRSERDLIHATKLRLRSSGSGLRRVLGLHDSWKGIHRRRRRRLHRDRGGLHGSTRRGALTRHTGPGRRWLPLVDCDSGPLKGPICGVLFIDFLEFPLKRFFWGGGGGVPAFFLVG
jgi:hypothetical protein